MVCVEAELQSETEYAYVRHCTQSPPDMAPQLPVELYCYVAEGVEQRDLPRLSAASRIFQVEAEALLYRRILNDARSQVPDSGGPDCKTVLTMAQVWCYICIYNINLPYASKEHCDGMQLLLSSLLSNLTKLVTLNITSLDNHHTQMHY
jgi:hypothetical protein